jgi:GTP-binding protein Era
MTQDDQIPYDFTHDLLFAPEELPEDHRSGFVAVIGRPNVGKSTLINGWLGQKIAIVSPKSQTTRQRLLGILTLPTAQVILMDTPGLHKPQHRLGDFMVDQAEQALPDADVICLLVDISVEPGIADRHVVNAIRGKAPVTPLLLAMNKLDSLPADKVASRVAAYCALVGEEVDWLALSALDPAGRADLLERVIRLLPFGPRYYPSDQITDQEERFIVAEMVREQVLHATHQEVPHSAAVSVQDFKERSPGLTYISATIYVERDSQKRIVLGKDGSLIKQIGQAARQEIEAMLGVKVYLELWVKVWPNWRKQESRLRELGYALPREIRQRRNADAQARRSS